MIKKVVEHKLILLPVDALKHGMYPVSVFNFKCSKTKFSSGIHCTLLTAGDNFRIEYS
jgi:hypothetical protein